VGLLTSDRPLSAGLAHNGKKYTGERYNWEKIKRLYFKIFKDFIRDKGSGIFHGTSVEGEGESG